MGVALSQTVLARRQQFHQSRLVEHIARRPISAISKRSMP
jgi:hypothetical protein